jgi:hypothetical protein
VSTFTGQHAEIIRVSKPKSTFHWLPTVDNLRNLFFEANDRNDQLLPRVVTAALVANWSFDQCRSTKALELEHWVSPWYERRIGN